MICPPCREAADKKIPKRHNDCTGRMRGNSRMPESSTASNSHCDCAHRQGHWINQETK